ncbi:hypothetical protein PAAG_04184 [Paracoccidioides lutzii Pb01]|uniref:Uncharacterized protein n=1 Tax=Paracoccidioides lutzii (strain ATCC MYA-826 / Pb01) TaxID=502779 RepID=C1H090_PARBA|nr:hypothetical protein PAAG_04184 [Paracoccidioides lutzii Pb01]EEH33131.2 hypothetical protein PAAG_04184 [Paracoccidioides lutzii Pb01]
MTETHPQKAVSEAGGIYQKRWYVHLCASTGLADGLIAVGIASAENGLGVVEGSKSTLVSSPFLHLAKITRGGVDVGIIFLIGVTHRVVTFMQQFMGIDQYDSHSLKTFLRDLIKSQSCLVTRKPWWQAAGLRRWKMAIEMLLSLSLR